MNRTVVMGLAIFFALVGIAMIGGESKAVAGHGCHGCGGCAGACDGAPACCGPVVDCCGVPDDCCGCKGRKRRCGGLFGGRRHHRCNGCAGACHGCAGGCAGYGCHGCGGAVIESDGGEAPTPPEGDSASSRRVIFRTASFRR